MKKRKKKRKIKQKVKVIFGILLIIILIGGFIIFMTNEDNDRKKTNTVDNKQNDIIGPTETVDGNINNTQEEKEEEKQLQKAPINNTEFSKLEDGEYETTNGNILTIKNGLTYVEGHLIANKTYKLPETFKPENPYQAITGNWCINCIDKDTMEAFKEMKSDASSIGLNIYIASGYRSYTNQDTLYNNYVSRDGKTAADTYSARPGHSEHQTGLCFDLNSVNDSFSYTAEGKWVNNNAHLYGFIIRYPKGKEEITGYQYESWHLRYVGEELAEKLYNNGNWLTMEEYFGLSSSY